MPPLLHTHNLSDRSFFLYISLFEHQHTHNLRRHKLVELNRAQIQICQMTPSIRITVRTSYLIFWSFVWSLCYFFVTHTQTVGITTHRVYWTKVKQKLGQWTRRQAWPTHRPAGPLLCLYGRQHLYINDMYINSNVSLRFSNYSLWLLTKW